ncbi:DUF6415 family natural product biosynthesis protein [Streptomyces spectabilis]|uniref:ATP-binding protein n=1 Tax=Streptomyces spectabilis TaxID=68270 RepID=A0A516R179_STRST|nr:DUF6415 family natural product biosynthesis protein [Streptomyces spectabilis]QDQ09390.1 ATP-binding protein [Streptomyces spectabilis]
MRPGAAVGRPPRRRPRIDVDQQLALRVKARAEVIPTLRHNLAGVLGGWGLAPTVDDALLVAGELVVHALACEPREFEVAVSHGHGRLLIEVATVVTPRPTRNLAGVMFGGYGPVLVQALSLDWGWAPHPGGRCVWALLAVHRAPTRLHSAARAPRVAPAVLGHLPAPGLSALIERVLGTWDTKRPESLPRVADAQQATHLLLVHLRPLMRDIDERTSRLPRSAAARQAAEQALAEARRRLDWPSGMDRLAAVGHAQRLARSARRLLRVRFDLNQTRKLP